MSSIVIWFMLSCVSTHFMSYSLTLLSFCYTSLSGCFVLIIVLHWCNTRFAVRLKNYIHDITHKPPLCIVNANIQMCFSAEGPVSNGNISTVALQVSTFVTSGRCALLVCERSRCGDVKGSIWDSPKDIIFIPVGSDTGESETQCYYSLKWLCWLYDE